MRRKCLTRCRRPAPRIGCSKREEGHRWQPVTAQGRESLTSMCDAGPVLGWLIAASVSIGFAILSVGYAILANASIVNAPMSPVAMITAGGCAVAAGTLLGLARSALTAACACAGKRCAAQCSTMNSMLVALLASVGVQATACFAAVLPAFVPFFGLPGMWTILVALASEAGIMIGALAFYSSLQACAKGG